MNISIQPGLLRIFRYFTEVAMGYFAVLVVFITLQGGEGSSPSQMQLYLNLLTNMGLSVYLSWSWLQRKLKGWYLPVALLIATIIPIFSNFFYLIDPQIKDLSLMIARSWLLFPILLVPMVLIAWQYNFRVVLVFTMITASVEIGVLFSVVGKIDSETLPILGLPLVRAFSFGAAGQIVNHLKETLQTQSKALLKANYRLSRYAETLEQLAVSRERNRLARELHDTLAHTLSGQAVNLEALRLMLPPEHREAQAMLDQALETTRSGLRETRRALKDLRSQPLEDLGLALAIHNLAKDAASRAEFELTLDIANNLPDLPPDAEQCIFRIAQESLENVIQHAQAQHVRLELGIQERRLVMVIHDNGKGIDLDTIDLPDRLGLHGMRERAAEIHAELKVSSRPGHGTTIHFSMEAPDDPRVDL